MYVKYKYIHMIVFMYVYSEPFNQICTCVAGCIYIIICPHYFQILEFSSHFIVYGLDK